MELFKNNKIKILVGALGLYLLVAGLSYTAFSYLASKGAGSVSPSASTDKKRAAIDTSAPKTEECPLNGQMYTKAEKDIWMGRRPLNVMIENHEDSRPQSGLSSADIIYEALAEGGVTRFMAVFYCGAAAQEVEIGPVRSARIYYMDWASEYGEYPLYAHVGGANKPGPADALGAIKRYGWNSYNDMNQFSIGFPTYWRDYERLGHEVATEHTMYSTTDKLWKVAGDRGLNYKDKSDNVWDENFTKWKFKDPSASFPQPNSGQAGQVAKVAFSFWPGPNPYSVEWNYDASSNTYKRVNGGSADKDFDNDTQIAVSNVVILYTRAKGPIDELKHMLYTTTGTGRALVFQNGGVVEATWSKANRQARTVFKDKKGKDIEFARGKIWIDVLDPSSKVKY